MRRLRRWPIGPLDTNRDFFRVQIDGHRIEVTVEQIGVDPKGDARILTTQHPRHRKGIRA